MSEISDAEAHNYAFQSSQARRAVTKTFFQTVWSDLACCPGREHEGMIGDQFDRTGPWNEEGNCCKKCCVWMCRRNCTCTSTLGTCSFITLICAATACVAGVGAELVTPYLYSSVDTAFNAAAPKVAIGGGIAMGSAVAAAACVGCIVGKYDCSPRACAACFDEEMVNDLANPSNWGESEKETLKRDLGTYGINAHN